MRAGEALSLTWRQIDLMDKTLRVGRAKTSNGTGRMIPINDDLASVLATHRAWARHATDITWGWDELRKDAGVSCRLHDLRHTFATHLAENGVSESTMLALMGNMSRAMLGPRIRRESL
jgi:integrase